MRSNLYLLTLLFSALIISTPLSAAPQKEISAAASKVDAKSYQLNEKGVQEVKSKNFAQAEALFKQALDVDKGNVTAAFNLGGIYITNRKETLAVKLLEEYTKQFPKDPGLWVRLGDAYFASKQVPEALKVYEAAFLLAQGYDGLAAKLATVYSLSNRLNDAEKMLLIAVDQEPKNGQLLANLSSVFLANGKADQAVSTAKRGLQVKPNADLYITLGNAYELKKDYKNSLISFQRALDMGSTKPELAQKIDQLKKAAS